MTQQKPYNPGFTRRLFFQLKRAGFSLGIAEYELMIEALLGGFGMQQDKEGLFRLYKMLWLKSEWDKYEFEFIFNRAWAEGIADKKKEDASPKGDTPKEAENNTIDDRIKPQDGEEQPPESSDLKKAKENMATEAEDESQVMRAQMPAEQDESISENKSINVYFSVDKDYLPVTLRRMQQQWRRLRRTRREGRLTELDIPASVAKICKEQMFLAPVLRPKRRNISRLILLLDCKGSMIAFHALGERLKNTVLKAGYLKEVQIYYFYNCPDQFLYKQSNMSEKTSLAKVLSGRFKQDTSLVIFSDAGAARGSEDFDRIEATEEFISEKATPVVRRLCWINPMPEHRWIGTSAEMLAESVKMFEASSRGFRQAIRYLQE